MAKLEPDPESTLYYVGSLPTEDGVKGPPGWAEPDPEQSTFRASKTLGESTASGSDQWSLITLWPDIRMATKAGGRVRLTVQFPKLKLFEAVEVQPHAYLSPRACPGPLVLWWVVISGALGPACQDLPLATCVTLAKLLHLSGLYLPPLQTATKSTCLIE